MAKADDEETSPPHNGRAMSDHSLNYDEMAHETLPSVVSRVLASVAEHGLPGEHHFYISFRTDHPGTEIPDDLREHFPNEMTIVLEHQFWNLKVTPDAFAVTLSFSGKRQQLRVPYESIITFADPSMQFEIRLNHSQKKRETVSEDTPTRQEETSTRPDPHALHFRRPLRWLVDFWQKFADRLTFSVERNPTKLRNIIYLSLPVVTVPIFVLTSSNIVRALMLMISINMVSRVFLGNVLRRLFRYFNERYAGLLAGGSAVLIAASFYLVTAEPTGYEAVIAWVLFSVFFLSFGITALEVFSENWLVGRLYREYETGIVNPARTPVIYVASERGMVETYCVAPLIRSLNKTVRKSRYLKVSLTDDVKKHPLNRTLFAHGSGRQMGAFFVIGNFLRPTLGDFRRWLVQNTDGFIAILAPDGLVDEFGTVEFGETLRLGYCFSKGRTICIEVSDEPDTVRFASKEYGEIGATEEYHLDPLEGMFFHQDAFAAIASTLASNIYVNFFCDITNDEEQQQAFELIRKDGLPIIADTVLPIRLGSSSVERFIALLEAWETLLAVTVLFGYIARGDTRPLGKRLKEGPIPFGGWLKLARNLLQKSVPVPNGLSSEISKYLAGDVSEAVYDRSVKLAQLLEHSLNSNKRIEWFKWLIDVRNKTRGHGITNEESARTIWTTLFQMLLSEFHQIRFLVFESKIAWADGDSGMFVYRGWKRAGVRTRSRLESVDDDYAGKVLLIAGNEAYALHPWIIVEDGDFQICGNGYDKKRNRFIYKRVTTRERKNIITTDVLNE